MNEHDCVPIRLYLRILIFEVSILFTMCHNIFFFRFFKISSALGPYTGQIRSRDHSLPTLEISIGVHWNSNSVYQSRTLSKPRRKNWQLAFVYSIILYGLISELKFLFNYHQRRFAKPTIYEVFKKCTERKTLIMHCDYWQTNISLYVRTDLNADGFITVAETVRGKCLLNCKTLRISLI